MADRPQAVSERAWTVIERLAAEDAAQRAAGLPSSARTRNVDPNTGLFLRISVLSLRPRLIAEIGSSNGLSTLWLASAAQECGGRVIGTEVIPSRAAEANAHLAAAGYASIAQVRVGDARSTLDGLEEVIDFVFLDAEKDDYVDHLLAIWPRLRVGGVVVADNVVSHDCSTYQSMLRARADAETMTLPLDRGLEWTIKRPAP